MDKINEQISSNRSSYFLNLSNQLNDKCLNPKKYWTLLISVYNNRKIPLIPPILKGNKYVSDLKKKLTILMSFLACNVLPLFMAQCFPINRIKQSPLLNQLRFLKAIF